VVAKATAGESRAAPERGGHERRCHGLAIVAVPRVDVTAGRSGPILLLCRFGPSWPHCTLGSEVRRRVGVLMTEPRLATLPARVVDSRGVEYTAEGIIEAIRRWAGRHGEPPTVADWDPARALRIGQQWRAERFRAGEWPTADIVRAAFRTFNAAVEAAGMTPQPSPRRAQQPVAVRPPGVPRAPDSASRLVWGAMAEAGTEVRRRGAEQIADQLRAVSDARRAGDPDALRAELVRLAGWVLAWADALPSEAG
jgi:hypothetical protein